MLAVNANDAGGISFRESSFKPPRRYALIECGHLGTVILHDLGAHGYDGSGLWPMRNRMLGFGLGAIVLFHLAICLSHPARVGLGLGLVAIHMGRAHIFLLVAAAQASGQRVLNLKIVPGDFKAAQIAFAAIVPLDFRALFG